MPASTFDRLFSAMPLIAILRGITPGEVVAVGEALVEAGVRLIEVPLNSPQPLDSIAHLARALANHALVGAGTVMNVADVEDVAGCGGQIIVSPNTNPLVIARARALGLVSLPGCFTPTEAALALESGAHALKLFPGESVTPASARALAAVLPSGTRLIVVGGVSVATLAHWVGGAVQGFGIGSALFKPGMKANEVGLRAAEFSAAWRDAVSAKP